jgi:hypothetical protein
MPQSWPPRQSDSDRSIDQQIAIIEQELARIVDLPTIPPDLRAELIGRAAAVKARATGDTPSAARETGAKGVPLPGRAVDRPQLASQRSVNQVK